MPRSLPQAVLLVDGYNIVGAWHELKKKRDRQGLEVARRHLIDTLIEYSAFQGFDTQIIFDAQYRDSPISREVLTPNVSVFYTNFGQTADTFIEKACADFRKDIRKFQQRLIVATSDRTEKSMVIGYGAEWMSAERLASEVEGAARRMQRQQSKQRQPSGRFLIHSLDPKAQEQLSRMRFGRSQD